MATMKKVTGENYKSMDAAHEPMYPRITFTENDLPEVRDWDVKGEYSITLKVRMVKKSTGRYPWLAKDTNKLTGTFEVREVGAEGEKKA